MRNKNSRSYVSSRIAALAALGLFFCSWIPSVPAQSTPDWKQKWDNTLSEAKKEGKVVVFGPPGEAIRRAMTDGFARAFPDIRIEYSGGRSAEQATRLKAEREGGIYSADIMLGGPTTANFQLKPIGALDPIRPGLILPEVTDLKFWRDNRLDFSDKEQTFNLVFVGQANVPLIYNGKQVKREEVDELQKLLDPKLTGKIVINDPLVSGSGVPFFRHIWVALGPEKASDYYRKLRAQAGAVDRDQRRQIEWIAQGRYAVLLAPSVGVMAQLIERGLRFEIMETWKDIGTHIGSSFGTVMLINRAPQPNAAKIFMNWVLSKDGQTAWSKAMIHASRRLDVPHDHLPPYTIPKSSGKYWEGYTEEAQTRTPVEEKILKELFGR